MRKAYDNTSLSRLPIIGNLCVIRIFFGKITLEADTVLYLCSTLEDGQKKKNWFAYVIVSNLILP